MILLWAGRKPVAATVASGMSAASALVSSEEVRAQLIKLLTSSGFINSTRLSKFLQLAVEETLAGQAERLMMGALGSAYAAAGHADRALEILRLLQKRAEAEYVDPLSTAAVQVWLNDRDGAFESLLKAIEGRSPMSAFVNVDPVFKPLRNDSRFERVLSELNLQPAQ
jgi:hypothetical protein